MKKMKIMTKIKEKFGSSSTDDEYIKNIQEVLNNLELYLKTKHAP